jgi:SAM-dependent methyltransferase
VCASAAAGTAIVTDDGFRIPAGFEAGLDVYFDDARAWSVSPSPYRARADGYRVIPWPQLLRRFLNGRSRVRIQEHDDGVVLFDAEQDFGTATGRISIVDADGRPLAIDKWGFINRPFDMQNASLAQPLLDDAEKLLAFLADGFGLPAFVSYGTLLGAIRDGHLIGHDNDVDLAYLSAYEDPADVVREVFQLTRELRRNDWRVTQRSGGFLTVDVRQPDGTPRNIDIYACFYLGETFYLTENVRTSLPRSAILPLSDVSLEGRKFPAPAHPEPLLAATYGESWRVPDPAFRYQLPSETRRRFEGWFGTSAPPRYHHWQRFYNGETAGTAPTEPSGFAVWVSEREPVGPRVIDVGTGNGRDAVYFAQQGHEVLGLDYAPAGLARARARGTEARFERIILDDLRDVLTTGARLAESQRTKIVYARMLAHALDDYGRSGLWLLASMALRRGGRLYLEFVTTEDNTTHHVFGKHFRCPLDPGKVVREIEQAGGKIEYREEGTGLAPYGDEDPHVCRLVARWSQ